MIRIGILGDIGSGKTYVAYNFGFPVFSADKIVAKLYKQNKEIYKKFKKIFPKYIHSSPIRKQEITEIILTKKNNLKKLVQIVHPEVRREMDKFIKRNKKKKFIIMDIPLLLENKINKKKDILVFVNSKKKNILKRLKGRTNFNKKLLVKFKGLQLPLDYKKKKSNFIINNNFTKKSVKASIRKILNELE